MYSIPCIVGFTILFNVIEHLVGNVVYSIAGAVYDIMSYVHPIMTVPHNGMLFSALSYDNDIAATFNCALSYGGAWWHTQCALWCPTTVNPVWFSPPDATFYSMEYARMMVKLQ